jgi:hypothetical protein
MSTETDDIDIREAAKAYQADLEAKKEQRQRQQIVEALMDWVWVSEATAFVRKSDRKVWTKEQWRTHYAHLHPKNGDIFNLVMRAPGLIQKFEMLTYEPGGGDILGTAFNLWRPSSLVAKEGDVSWFIDHLRYLFDGDETSVNLLLDFMSLLVREPAQKILFALLLHGKHHGTGKSIIARLLTKILGDHNVVQPSIDELNSQFTAWQEGRQLCIVNEMMMLGQIHLANKFKNDITEPVLRIRAMHRVGYSLPNYLNFFLTSNYPDAVKLENEDRRYLVLQTEAKPRDDAYYTSLVDHIESADGAAAVKHYLLNRDVQLNPKGRAPVTMAKQQMKEQSLQDEEAYVLQLFDEGEAPFDFDLLRINDIIDAVQSRFGGHHKNLMGRMTTLLKDRIGAVKHTRNTTPGNGQKKYHLWSVRDHEKWRQEGPTARLQAYEQHHRGFYTSTPEDEETEPT